MDDVFETPQKSASSGEVRDILTSARTVAVVGLSDKPERASYEVAAYLQGRGYRILPVNPRLQTVLGERVYASLREVPLPIDVVDIFRRVEAIPGIVEEAIAVQAKAIWMQDGLEHRESAEKARAAGLRVVMNRCMMRDHHALGLPSRRDET